MRECTAWTRMICQEEIGSIWIDKQHIHATFLVSAGAWKGAPKLLSFGTLGAALAGAATTGALCATAAR